MSAGLFCLLTLLGQIAGADAEELVSRLGSGRYAERQEATSELEKLGRAALPALRSARESHDPEVRNRASTLLARIEAGLLTQPTALKLEFQDAPLVEVLKTLSEQAGIRFTLVPENAPALRDRRVTIHESSPLPFWKAVDRLSEVARLQFTYGPHGAVMGREPVFPMFASEMRHGFPTCDSGPFRVILMGLNAQQAISFPMVPIATPREAGKIQAARTEQFFVQLQVIGEPRLNIAQMGPLLIQEAVDGEGHSLAVPRHTANEAQRMGGFFGGHNGSMLQLQAPLSRPENSPRGGTLRSLKGSLLVGVSSRKASPLTVNLKGADGRTFSNEDAALTVHEVKTLPNTRLTSIELTIRPVSADRSAIAPGVQEVVSNRPEQFQQQIEVVDTTGRAIPWYQSSFDGESGRMTVTLTSPDQVAKPGELRYYTLARATAEVKFEFRDIALP